MNTPSCLSILIAAPEGIMSSALRTYLETLPGVKVVARTTSQAETLCELVTHRPRFLLLDCDLKGFEGRAGLGLQAFLAQVQVLAPETRTIAIINDPRQDALARSAGAGQAIFKNELEIPLHQAIELVLPALYPAQ